MKGVWKNEFLIAYESSTYGGVQIMLGTSPIKKQYIILAKFIYRGKNKEVDYKKALFIPVEKYKDFLTALSAVEINENG